MSKQIFNPFLPSYEYIPDGEPHVFGERIYIFGSHDRFDGAEYCMNDYVVWSAPVMDLKNWRYDGVIYRKEQDPCNDGNHPNLSKTSENGIHYMYAPDVCKGPDGKYYLYYNLGDLRRISVARCDTPSGRYEFYGYVHDKEGKIVGEREGDYLQGDPAVLVDDNNRIYLFSGNAPMNRLMKKFVYKSNHSMVEELDKDMLTIIDGPHNLIPDITESGHEPGNFKGHELFEASSIRKINDTYYFIYSDINWTNLCYATSKEPMKGYTYRGVIISNGDVGLRGYSVKKPVTEIGNNHGSIENINGQWYVFYHRQTNRNNFSRQACAEPITIDEDGSIRQVEITSCGLNGGPLKGKGAYSSHIACALWNEKGHNTKVPFFGKAKMKYPYITQDVPDIDAGGDELPEDCQYVANMKNKYVCGFKSFAFENPTKIAVEVRGKANGVIQVYEDELLNNKICTITIEECENWKWFENQCDKIIHGTSPLYFQFVGKGVVEFNSFRIG